jgi:hypothetical protein
VPVSRKRKKSPKSAAAVKADRRREQAKQVRNANAMRRMFSGWEKAAAQRVEDARPHAVALIERLRQSPATGPALEDELCARLGPLLTGLADRTPPTVAALLDPANRDRIDELIRASDAYIGPEHFAEALADAAGAITDPDDPAAVRVATAITAVLPSPLRERTGVDVPAPGLSGEAMWTRDRYGTRFAVVAPFAVPGSPVRWYLWDVDACGLVPVPVHAGFYASPEEALAAWQVGVGPAAAGGTTWRAVDDSVLLRGLLPALQGMMALGGESVEQHAEYLRCRRLAEVLLESVPVLPFTRPDDQAALTVGWLDTWAGAPEDDRDAAEAVAMAWPADVPALFASCSPHRVAHVAHALRDEYPDDFAEKAIALLPQWVEWLAKSTGLPADLAERARPYAEGREHPDLLAAGRDSVHVRLAE